MPGSLLTAAQALRDALGGFEPGLYSGEDCAALVEELAATEKACGAARAQAAARAADCGAHRQKGFADAADWLARATGTSSVEAKTALDTARALGQMPHTKAAFEAGELSLAQAHELARTEADCPGSESELVEVAKTESLKTLKKQARKRRLESIDPEDLHARQHRARSFRHIPAELRTALELGAPPDFEGVGCSEAGCDRRHGLEWDHVNPRANGGRASYENLAPRCGPHHRDKTERDRRAGLLQAAGQGRDPP